VNLRMEISGLDVDAIDALSSVEDGVRNPDEISLSFSEEEDEGEGEKYGERAKGIGEDEKLSAGVEGMGKKQAEDIEMPLLASELPSTEMLSSLRGCA
jgi:hypothetical protein